MKKWKEYWKQLLGYEKVFYVLGLTSSLTVIVFGVLAILQRFDIMSHAVPFLPIGLILMGVDNFFNAVYTWRQSRGSAIVALCCGVFVIVCAVIGLMLL